ncbi:MAG: hypothetical protein AVDCRST_MAG40-1008, partial [uncultured Gemmatimonadaceae bacterium]
GGQGDVLVVPRLRLRRGAEQRGLEAAALHQAARQRLAGQRAVLAVLLPRRPREV